jgi:hypothetical protein
MNKVERSRSAPSWMSTPGMHTGSSSPRSRHSVSEHGISIMLCAVADGAYARHARRGTRGPYLSAARGTVSFGAAARAAFRAQHGDRSHTVGGTASTPVVEFTVRVHAYGVHLFASHQMLLTRSSCPSEFPWLQNNDHPSGRRVPHGVDVMVSPGWGGATFWVEVTITGPLSTDGQAVSGVGFVGDG